MRSLLRVGESMAGSHAGKLERPEAAGDRPQLCAFQTDKRLFKACGGSIALESQALHPVLAQRSIGAASQFDFTAEAVSKTQQDREKALRALYAVHNRTDALESFVVHVVTTLPLQVSGCAHRLAGYGLDGGSASAVLSVRAVLVSSEQNYIMAQGSKVPITMLSGFLGAGVPTSADVMHQSARSRVDSTWTSLQSYRRNTAHACCLVRDVPRLALGMCFCVRHAHPDARA